MIRPGPPWIEPDKAPGGLVVHCYTTDHPPRLLFTRLLMWGIADLEAVADADGVMVRQLIATNAPVVLVTYDGDTGERMIPSGVAPPL